MNEELFSLLTLDLAGFDTKHLFEEKLNVLFLQNPENRDLLELECIDFHEAGTYFSKHFDFEHMHLEKLYQYLIEDLNYFYERLPFEQFSGKIAELWDVLPFHSSQKENPFYRIYYFSEMLADGKHHLLKEHIKRLLSYDDQ